MLWLWIYVCLCMGALPCAHVRACMRERGERGRDVLEARKTGERCASQTAELVVVQEEHPAGDTHERDSARTHARQPMLVSAGRHARVPHAAGGCDSRVMHACVCVGREQGRRCSHAALLSILCHSVRACMCMMRQEGQTSRKESSGTCEPVSVRVSVRASAAMCTCACAHA